MNNPQSDLLDRLKQDIKGELYYDDLHRKIYATDASVYQEVPLAVAIPKTKEDLQKIVKWCFKNEVPLIPRAAGTSLAGQCVGEGIVVDISKNFKRIYDLNVEEKTVWVEPGVIRDELNVFLEPYGLHFGPNTSTANRCMIGGMVGNNSCGSSSIKYGSTRDHVLALDTILSNGEIARFDDTNEAASMTSERAGSNGHSSFKTVITKAMNEMISDQETATEIKKQFPHPEVTRRNTGYALDILLNDRNLCALLTGSEGTLAFTTAVKLSLDPLPGKERVVLCPHYNSVHDAMKAIPAIMELNPDMCELMDKVILDCTKANKKQQKNRFFLQGDPQAVLMVQFNRHEQRELIEIVEKAERVINQDTAAYSVPKVYAPDDQRVFELRAAGLGVLANLPGDSKAVACIEDTAVRIKDLADYISEFEKMMSDFNQKAVFYAHAGAGEIHLRPILNLKKSSDVKLFYEITKATALLVKKYKGSLSGEHGDGRVRAEFIPLMVGEKIYSLFEEVKSIWDPKNIFNPGKIVHPASMTSSLRYIPDIEVPEPQTLFRFTETGGMIRAAEKCNGSGDCRKLSFANGTMCPSYQATRDEKDSTRARANALRVFLSQPKDKTRPFDSEEVKEVLDLCLSCKACGTECPSNVDMTTLKAEFTHQYQKLHGSSLRSKIFANFETLNQLGSKARGISNFTLNRKIFKRTLGIAEQRSLPAINKITLKSFLKDQPLKANGGRSIFLFVDEFSNYNDQSVGQKTVLLLSGLGYKIEVLDHAESGRAAFSKGFLDKAKKAADQNVRIFSPLVTAEKPLVGIEPSAILGFRDEYPKIVSEDLISDAEALAKNTLTLEEFLFREIENGKIEEGLFDAQERTIYVHGHCHQKALSSTDFTARILAIPRGHSVQVIPSGCCGMAGSFGYEKEHYEISMKIGEETLFPALRKVKSNTIIAASGTSCRHQIKDGLKMESFHPAEILYDALLKK